MVTIDEYWHWWNILMVAYYLKKIDRLSVVFAILFAITQPCFALLFSGDHRVMEILYYVGSFMEGYFIILLQKQMSVMEFVILMTFQIFLSYMVSFNNAFGRLFIESNIAGCAYISEFMILYLVNNGVYTKYAASSAFSRKKRKD